MNPPAVAVVYGDADPSLENVRLLKITIASDGPTIQFEIDTGTPIAVPSSRWKNLKYNSTVIQFQCIGVKSVSLQQNNIEGEVSCNFSKEESGGILVSIVGKTFEFTARCGFLSVNSITPFWKPVAV